MLNLQGMLDGSVRNGLCECQNLRTVEDNALCAGLRAYMRRPVVVLYVNNDPGSVVFSLKVINLSTAYSVGNIE